MKKLLFSVLFVLPMIMVGNSVLADTPSSLSTPDKHSIEVKGKITLYRVQVQDMEFGSDHEKIDAEVLVTLDGAPNKVLTIRLHDDSPPVNMLMANTLRDAYLNNKKVTIYYQITPVEKQNVKILMVQMD